MMKRKLSRRSFIRQGALGSIATAFSSGIMTGCKGEGPTTPEEPPKPPVPVNLSFNIYNHTQGLRGSFTKDGIMSGSDLSLDVAALIADHNITDCDTKRIVLREEKFGKLIDFQKQGSLTLKVPENDTSYDIFMFNAASSGIYDWSENDSWGMKLMLPDYATPLAFRKDFNDLTGEERIWSGEILPETGDVGAIDQINRILDPDWAPFQYGHIERRPAGGPGTFSYGFGNPNGAAYWSTQQALTINPLLVPDIVDQVARGISLIYWTLRGGDGLLGKRFYEVGQTGGIINQSGADALAYMYVTSSYAYNRGA